VAVAVTQASWLAERLPAQTTAELALDGGYGNLKFFGGMRGVKTFATARMRNDRVLYQLPQAPPKRPKEEARPPTEIRSGIPLCRSADLACAE
jgi:hypothetical protein